MAVNSEVGHIVEESGDLVEGNFDITLLDDATPSGPNKPRMYDTSNTSTHDPVSCGIFGTKQSTYHSLAARVWDIKSRVFADLGLNTHSNGSG